VRRIHHEIQLFDLLGLGPSTNFEIRRFELVRFGLARLVQALLRVQVLAVHIREYQKGVEFDEPVTCRQDDNEVTAWRSNMAEGKGRISRHFDGGWGHQGDKGLHRQRAAREV
jgi:hypothetical protein